jgi:NADPH2:quinone reductase
MRAATVSRFGGPEVFEVVETHDPVPGPGEVLISVEVIDTLWLETMVRSGAWQDSWPMRPPYVPGNGVAGRISEVGTGVDPNLLGRRVAAHTGGEGGYADRVVVAAETVVPVPGTVDLPTAAALLHDGATALALFDTLKVGPRDRVLVLGASGGLGLLCVQLARHRAAAVVAVARGAKLERVARLGPDAVIDSDRPDWVEQARAVLGASGADVVLDNIGGSLGEAAFTLTAPGARFSAHGTPSGRFAPIDRRAAEERGVSVTGIETVQLADSERKFYVEQALREAAAGVIAPIVGQTFPLEQAGAAHAAIEGRTVFGKTLITVTA